QGCLACKACATQCPIRVDVPDFRAQFLELYHRRYARPLGDYFTAQLERILPLLVLLPRLANLLVASAPGRWLLPRVAKAVVLLQDAFTTFYEPAVLEATCLLLQKLGYQPHVLPYFENGKAL